MVLIFFQFRFSDERSGTRGEGGIWGTEKGSKNVHMVRRLGKKKGLAECFDWFCGEEGKGKGEESAQMKKKKGIRYEKMRPRWRRL